MNRRIMRSALLLALLIFLGVGQVTAKSSKPLTLADDDDDSEETFVVDDDRLQCPDADHQSIQAAVLAARPGATIEVCPGSYDEIVNVPKTLTILGAQRGEDARERSAGRSADNDSDDDSGGAGGGESVVNGSFTLQANSVVIDGFTIQNGPDSGVFTSEMFSGYEIRNNILQINNKGVYLNSNGVKPTEVEHNLFNANRCLPDASKCAGVYSDLNLSNARIEENKFTDNSPYGILLGGPLEVPGTEIMGKQSNVTIRKNEFRNHGNHILLFFTTDSEVSDNVAAISLGAGFGFGNGVDGVTVTGNTVQESGTSGIVLANVFDIPTAVPTNVLVKGNMLVRNNTNGIDMREADGNSVRGNKIEENQRDGISIRFDSDNNIIRENKCLRNLRDGIQVSSGSGGNTITRNTVLDNVGFDASDFTVGAGTAGTENFWINNHCRTENRPGLCKHANDDDDD